MPRRSRRVAGSRSSHPRSVSSATRRCTVGIGRPSASEISFCESSALAEANSSEHVEPASERSDRIFIDRNLLSHIGSRYGTVRNEPTSIPGPAETVDATRPVRVIDNDWIELPDGVRLAIRLWLPEDAEARPVSAILDSVPYRKSDGTAI